MEAFKSYIPGFLSSNEEHHQKHSEEDHQVHDTVQPKQGGGILSYIPGMGGGSTEQQTGNNAGMDTNEGQGGKGKSGYGRDEDTYDKDRVNYGKNDAGAYGSDAPTSDARLTRSGATYNTPSDGQKYGTDSGDLGTGDQTAGAYKHNQVQQGYGGQDLYKQGMGEGYGKQAAGQGYGADNLTEDYGKQAAGQAYGADNPTEDYSHGGQQIMDTDAGYGAGGYGNLGSKNADNNTADTELYDGGKADTGYHRGLDSGDGNGVRGAPIRGPNVKGYAVSAPVGREGDSGYDDEQNNGRPKGKVAGAHMQYGPVSGDDRDTTGRGTVSRTDGEGDSSYSNVKRNIPGGDEHVISQTSSSRVQRTSFTQT